MLLDNQMECCIIVFNLTQQIADYTLFKKQHSSFLEVFYIFLMKLSISIFLIPRSYNHIRFLTFFFLLSRRICHHIIGANQSCNAQKIVLGVVYIISISVSSQSS